MESIPVEKISEIKRAKKELEEKLNVKITIKGKTIYLEGSPLDEYEALMVIEAIGFGFSAQKALKIKDPEIQFKVIPIKEFAKKKKLEDVRARIIGKEGGTLRTLEELSGCHIKLSNNEVGIIGFAEALEPTETAIKNLIKGSKQSNVYRFLEKSNTLKKEEEGDLGFKE